jgi:hypothetical protein
LWKYNASDILINKVDHAIITDLEFYLKSIKNCANNTAVKYIRNFRKIIKICLKNDWLEKNPFSKYEGKVYEIDKEFLTEEEIQKIYAKKFMNTRLEQVRDIFIFCCFTGLAYIDVQQLTSDHLEIGIDDNKWIFKNRQKTDTRSKIPLLPFDINQDVVKSIAKTNRLLVIDEDVPGGASAYILQQIIEQQNAYNYLDSKPQTLTAKAHRPAYGTDGDYFSKPSTEDIFEKVYAMMNEVNPSKYPNLY